MTANENSPWKGTMGKRKIAKADYVFVMPERIEYARGDSRDYGYFLARPLVSQIGVSQKDVARAYKRSGVKFNVMAGGKEMHLPFAEAWQNGKNRRWTIYQACIMSGYGITANAMGKRRLCGTAFGKEEKLTDKGDDRVVDVETAYRNNRQFLAKARRLLRKERSEND